MAARQRDPARRRNQLIAAAAKRFGKKGVAATSVDEIVRAAGVAKGTFYLYFASKEDAVNAVVEGMVDAMFERLRGAMEDRERPAAERIVELGRALVELGQGPKAGELFAAFHRPGNRSAHDRMAERMATRLMPLMERVIAQGIAEGEFAADDARVMAGAALGAFMGLDWLVRGPDELEAAADQVGAFILRGLGQGLRR